MGARAKIDQARGLGVIRQAAADALRSRAAAVRGSLAAMGLRAPSTVAPLLGAAGVAGGPATAIVAAAAVAALFVRNRLSRVEQALAGLVESRGGNAVPSVGRIMQQAFQNGDLSLALRGVETGIVHAKNALVGSASAGFEFVKTIATSFNPLTIDAAGERALIEARHAYWKHQIYPPASVYRENAIENKRFQTQIDRGGTMFGGWGKIPEAHGG